MSARLGLLLASGIALSAILLGGCGGNGTPSALGVSQPQVLDYGGPVLTAPTVQPIAYGDDENLADMEAFLQELTRTTYWSDATSQYGVGALTVLPTLHQPGTAPATLTDDQVNAALEENLTGASGAWGAPSASTIYLFLVPKQTALTGPGGACCTQYDGYHSQSTTPLGAAGVYATYAMSCACPGFDGPSVTDVQQRTVVISHELVEAATDPLVQTNPAYLGESATFLAWTLVTGGETADLCWSFPDANVVPPGSTYMIQRVWSNEAASAGQNPCVPVVTKDPFFESVPQLPGVVAVPTGGASIDTAGVTIPVGGSKTIDVALQSDAPTKGPWSVMAVDGHVLDTDTSYLKLSLDKATGQSGDTLHLTIEVTASDPELHVEPFVIISTLNGQSSLSMGLVGQ